MQTSKQWKEDKGKRKKEKGEETGEVEGAVTHNLSPQHKNNRCPQKDMSLCL